MEKIKEIYLTKKYVTKDSWLKLIEIISRYNGLLKSWKIIIKNDKNQLRYFIKSKCLLPASINNLNDFLLKDVDDIDVSYQGIALPYYFKIGSNVVDMMNYLEIKNKGVLEYIDISFRKLGEEKIVSKTKIIWNKNGVSKCYKVILGIPANILSVDFDGNKRYFYKSVPKYLDINKILHLLESDDKMAMLKIDTFPYLQGDFYLKQQNYNFDKHAIVIGSSGSGKSKFISSFIYNIYRNPNLRDKYKIVMIDPHADSENDIGAFSKVVDFKSLEDSINLFVNNASDVVASTELLIDLFKGLLADLYNAKLERVLRHSIYVLLTNESFNFKNLRKIILDLEYRSGLLQQLKMVLPMSVVEFFLADFNELKTKAYTEAISPIIGFIDEMEMLPVFNKDNYADDLSNVMKNNFLTLFSLDRTKLGDKVTKTIAGLVMQQLLTLIQKREMDEHIIFIVDEVATVENPILSRFLSEARKYNLSLVLAGQYFNQITQSLKDAIFANVINYYIFRVSKIDASLLVDNFNMKIPIDDSKEAKIKLITELNNRECIVRVDSNGVLMPAFKATTLDFVSQPRVKKEISNVGKNEVRKDEVEGKKFVIGNNVSLKELMKRNSASRKEVI